jgi:hypothetical protein
VGIDVAHELGELVDQEIPLVFSEQGIGQLVGVEPVWGKKKELL